MSKTTNKAAIQEYSIAMMMWSVKDNLNMGLIDTRVGKWMPNVVSFSGNESSIGSVSFTTSSPSSKESL